MKKLLYIFLIVIVSLNVSATNYYVKTGGNDSSNGLSDTTAWSSLSKVNSITLQPGDTVFFKRGDTWKGMLEPRGDGVSGNNIVISAYGEGNRPIITARNSVSGWSTAGNWTKNGNVWSMSFSRSRTRIWLDGVEIRKNQTINVTANDPFFADGVKLYLYSTTNPALTYQNIETSWGSENAIYFDADNYFTIQNLDLRGGYHSMMIYRSSGIIVDSCDVGMYTTVHGCCGLGEVGANSDNCIVSNCMFDCGSKFESNWEIQYNVDGLNMNRGTNSWRVYGNYFKNWNHSSVYVIGLYENYTNHDIWIYDNYFTAPDVSYGRAFNIDVYKYNGSGLKIFNNIVHDMPTRNQINCYGLEFYCNIINMVTGVSFRTNVGQGVDFSGYAKQPETGEYISLPSNMKVYNNVFSNCYNAGFRFQDSHYLKENNVVINNIFYNNNAVNNYQLEVGTSLNKVGPQTVKNNLFYKSGVTNLIYYRGTGMTPSEFNAMNGNVGDVIGGNIAGNPLFKGGIPFDYHVNYGSPAIGKGLNVGLLKDIEGNDWKATPSLGVYEYIISAIEDLNSERGLIIYPNPAKDFIRLKILDPILKTQTLRFFDSYGRLCMEHKLQPDILNVYIPLNLKPGVYFVQGSTREGLNNSLSQKLIIL